MTHNQLPDDVCKVLASGFSAMTESKKNFYRDTCNYAVTKQSILYLFNL